MKSKIKYQKSKKHAAVELYHDDAGIVWAVDNRHERAGVKFNDADLIGIPYRITVGTKKAAAGKVEILQRKSRQSQDVHTESVVELIRDIVK